MRGDGRALSARVQVVPPGDECGVFETSVARVAGVGG